VGGSHPLLHQTSGRRHRYKPESPCYPLNKLHRADPVTAAQVSDLRRIVALRNVLVHGYAVIDNELVWEVATTRAPYLAQELGRLLLDPGE